MTPTEAAVVGTESLDAQRAEKPWDEQRRQLAGAQRTGRDADAIRAWIANPAIWPAADSYDLETLEPCATLAIREQELRSHAPAWFWGEDAAARILSIGTGKAYFERKYWTKNDRIYVVDPSENTRLGLTHFPLANVEYLGGSLYDAALPTDQPPAHGWLGASIHYLFGEFHGWHFMQRLAMMVSDTLVVDAGVFDSDSPHGRYLLETCWTGTDRCELHRRETFSWAAFEQAIAKCWSIVDAWPTEWIPGRRSLVLQRKLPPRRDRSRLTDLSVKVERQDKPRDNWTVFKTEGGYYKDCTAMAPLLVYDTFSKMAGWDDLVQFVVYDGDEYRGFVVNDLGNLEPDDSAVCETVLIQALVQALPLGLVPADVAKCNIRMVEGKPVWFDIFFLHVRELDPFLALWTTTSLYKHYPAPPAHAPAANRFAPMLEIPVVTGAEVQVRLRRHPTTMTRGVDSEIEVEIVNRSGMTLTSVAPYPLHISYHWHDAHTGACLVHDGERSVVDPAIEDGAAQIRPARVRPPNVAGRCQLQVRLVQERVRWFAAGDEADCLIDIT
jgi:hypothetical protein